MLHFILFFFKRCISLMPYIILSNHCGLFLRTYPYHVLQFLVLRHAYYIPQEDYELSISCFVGNNRCQPTISGAPFKSVFCSHHSVHHLKPLGCRCLIVLFVERVSRGSSPTLLIVWHGVNCTTCRVSMQQQQWHPPSQTTAK